MDEIVSDYMRDLLSEESYEKPCDTCKPTNLELDLPPWFDEDKYRRGQQFFRDNFVALFLCKMSGLISVLAVPTILNVLIATRRSSSSLTSYKRYLSTILHILIWYDDVPVPGSQSWKSLQTVRLRHLRASQQATATGVGRVSQRDLALTQFGFIGFALTRQEDVRIVEFNEGGLEGLIHIWRTIGYMLGLEDRYNICRETVDETKAVCRAISHQVFRPYLVQYPEYFIHMSSVLFDGVTCLVPHITYPSYLYFTRWLANVPGFEYGQKQVEAVRKKLLQRGMLNGVCDASKTNNNIEKVENTKIDKFSLDNLPDCRPEDYESLETVPEYKKMKSFDKFTLNFMMYLHRKFYNTRFGRWYLNNHFWFNIFLIKNFPFLAYFKFGIKQSYVNIFADSMADDTQPKRNDELSFYI